jgi:ABC-2 type transport system ATP-binding protein
LKVRLREAGDRPEARRLLTHLLDADVRADSDPRTISARVCDPDAVAGALAELSRAGVSVTEFELGQPSLDEVFLALTRQAADDHAVDEVAA